MVDNHVDDNDDNNEGEPMEYEFIDGDDQKSFFREHPPHILYLWHLTQKYGILRKVRQLLVGCSSVDGLACFGAWKSFANVSISTSLCSLGRWGCLLVFIKRIIKLSIIIIILRFIHEMLNVPLEVVELLQGCSWHHH